MGQNPCGLGKYVQKQSSCKARMNISDDSGLRSQLPIIQKKKICKKSENFCPSTPHSAQPQHLRTCGRYGLIIIFSPTFCAYAAEFSWNSFIPASSPSRTTSRSPRRTYSTSEKRDRASGGKTGRVTDPR